MEQELKKQLTDVHLKLEQLSKDIIRLTVINEHQYEERQANSVKIEKMENDFTSAKGAILTLKWLISMLGAGAIAFCTWIVTSNNEHQKELATLNQKVAILEKEVNDLENYNEKTFSSSNAIHAEQLVLFQCRYSAIGVSPSTVRTGTMGKPERDLDIRFRFW